MTDSALFFRMSRDMTPLNRIGYLRRSSVPISQNTLPTTAGRAVSIRTTTIGAIDPNRRSGTVTLGKSHIAVFDDRQPEVRLFTPAGSLQRILRWDPAAVEVAPQQPNTTGRVSRPSGSLGFFIDSEDRIWVENSRASGAERHVWTVFDTGGAMLGRFWLPADYGLRDVRGGLALVGFAKDDDPHLAVLRIIASSLSGR
jgi:hypothetical protein